MKTLLIAAAAALIVAPAFAQVPAGTLGAIAHFNQDATSQDERTIVTEGTAGGLATRAGLSEAQIRFNMDKDSANDRRRVTGASVVSGELTHGQAIFAQIQAASAEDE